MDARSIPLGLFADVADILTERGVRCEQVYGEKGREASGSPPRYVWVPQRMRDRNALLGTALGDVRALFAGQVHVEIDCWGVNEHQAWALCWNALNAIYELKRADLTLEGVEWIRPGGAANQRGELLRLEVSINVPIGEGYIPLDSLLLPEQQTWIPARIETDIYNSPTVHEDGEFGIKVTT